MAMKNGRRAYPDVDESDYSVNNIKFKMASIVWAMLRELDWGAGRLADRMRVPPWVVHKMVEGSAAVGSWDYLDAIDILSWEIRKRLREVDE